MAAADSGAANQGDDAATSPAGDSDSGDSSRVTRFQKFQSRTIHRSEITSAPYNPRILSPAQKRKLKRLIQKHGFVGGMTWNEQTGILVGGHQRLSILDDLEKSDDYWVTVDVVNVDAVEERAMNLSLNNPEAQGQFDIDLYGSLVAEVLESGIKPEDIGHDVASIGELFGDDFLSPHVADQAETEAPLLDIFSDIKEAGREASREASQGRRGTGRERDVRLVGSQDLLDDAERGMTTEGDGFDEGGEPGSDELSSRDSDGDEDATSDSAGGESGDQSHPPAGKRTWTKGELAARRKEYAASFDERNNADTFVTIVFETQTTLKNFMRAIKLDDRRRAFSFDDVLASIEAVGIGKIKAMRENGFAPPALPT